MLIMHLFVTMHTLICVTFSLPPGVRGWLRLLLVALPGLFCLPFCCCLCNPEKNLEFCIYDNVICKAEIVNKPSADAGLPSWSHNASHMIFTHDSHT